MPDKFEKYSSEQFKQSLGARLKEIRLGALEKVTQSDVASDLKVERQHINRIENGKVSITIQEMIYYCYRFHYSIDDIIYAAVHESLNVLEKDVDDYDYYKEYILGELSLDD